MFWVKFSSWHASGRPAGSFIVERPADWEPEGRAEEEAADNADFFGPFASREEAWIEECRVWEDQVVYDADGFCYWRH